MTWLQSAVRRWGWRTVGVVVTSFGIYVVIPSLITLLGAWPDLGQVRPWWFAILFVLELASFAATWALLRVALPHTSWTAVATSQVVGNAASKVLPGGAATGGVVQGKVLVQAGQPGAVVATALAAGAPWQFALGLSAALGLVLAVLGGLSLQLVRRLNARAIQHRAAALAAGESSAIRRLQYGGLLRDALRGALLTSLGLLAAWVVDSRVRLDGSTAPRWS